MSSQDTRQTGKQWNSMIKDFLERGDMSIWKSKMTNQIQAVTEVHVPSYRQPPYEQRADVPITINNNWLLDQVAPLTLPQELPVVNPDTDKTDVATTLLGTIKPGEIIRYNFPEKKKLGYDFTDYRISGNPLVMLFGASIECFRQKNRLPDMLFISRRLEPALERESMEFYGAYDGRFRLYHPKALAGIKKVPVMTESHLPDELKLAFERDYPVDCVIALVEK